MHESLAVDPVWTSKRPEFSKPGQMRQFSRDRVDAGLLWHGPLRIAQVGNQRERTAAAVCKRLS